MQRLQTWTGPDGVVRVQKSYSALVEENASLAEQLDYITKEELIQAVLKLATAIKQLDPNADVGVGFTYQNLKNDI